MTPPTPTAAVVIATRNRREELWRAIDSALRQSARPRVVVIDDGSDDDYGDELHRRFPAVRYERLPRYSGIMAARNRGVALAEAPFVFSIDDDAVFTSDDTIERTLPEFDDPRVGAVSMPYHDIVAGEPQPRVTPPPGPGRFVVEYFIGTSHALRRGLFLALGGYREVLFTRCEERDYCVRMLDRGCVTVLGRTPPIEHRPSPRRPRELNDRLQARNYAWYVVHNVPTRHAPLHLLGTLINQTRQGWRYGYTLSALRGLAAAVVGIPGQLRHRRPVSPATYRLARRLQYHGPLPMDEVVAALDQAGTTAR